MNDINEEKEIKIKIKKENARIFEKPEENMASAFPAGSAKEEKKFFNPEKLATFFFYALVFLMPIFALPLAVAPLASGKAILFFGGILLTAFFWILAALQKGSVKIPQSALLISCAAVVLVWLASALSSGNASLSLAGKLYDLDTFSVFFAASLALFFGSMIFQSEKRAFVFYLLLFLSSFIAFAFQFFHLIFGINIIPFNIFPYNTSNLIGGWNDFSIFFGFIGLVSLALLETAKFGWKMKIFFYFSLIMSFLAMISANFFNNWIIFGVFSLLIFIMALFKSRFSEQAKGVGIKNFFRVSLFVLLAVIFFTFFRETAGNINNILKTSSTEVRPSWSATLDIARKSLKDNAVLGTGPNTFVYDWLKFKPAAVNNTIFWNVRFSSGVGYFPSTMATTGILGIAAIAVFLIILLSYWKKVFSREENSARLSGGQSTDTLTISSFLSAIYLWTFIIFYAPGILIFTLAFVITGVFLALLANGGKIGVAEVSFSGKTKSGMIFMVVGIILLIGTASSAYFYTRKFLALNNYGQALKIFEKSGDIDKAGKKLTQAAGMDKQDEYYRALSELGLVSLSQIVASKDIPADRAAALFRDNLGIAIAYAREAARINPADPVNWMQLGRVYESVVALKVEKADEAALNSYAEAFKVSPLDPSPFVASARVAMQTGKINDARKYLQSALNLKPDFADALFILSQIEAQSGNLKEAILKTEQAATVSPNSPGIFFQLGLLRYQNNNLNAARTAFERAVGLNNNYANARYFLGLIYDRQGLKEKAIEQFAQIAKTNPNNEEVKKILSNLKNGRSALAEISPPAPENREEPPISEKEQTSLKKSKKN